MGKVISISMSELLALCIKHVNRFTQKLKLRSVTDGSSTSGVNTGKSFVSVVSNKAIKLVQRKKTRSIDGGDDFGDGGVWQRSILMGDKCQPLDFSGVIYYDSNGKQLNEVPLRSPRASPLPAYLVQAGRDRV